MDLTKFAFIEGILVGIGVTFIMIEITLNLNDTEDDTTNVLLNNWSKQQYIFIPFAIGAIGGHLFLGSTYAIWPVFYSTLDGLLTVLVLVVLSLMLLLVGIIFRFKRTKAFINAILLLGVLYGHYFWSMNIPENL